MENHKFWNTQPIFTNNDNTIVENVDINNIKKDPIKLVDKYHWYNIDLDNENDLNELYSFLLDYYVNNINAVYRFNYSKETFKWFLKPKTFFPDLILGVKFNNKLVSTIIGIPQTVRILDKIIKVVQINFLCVHPNIRNKRLAPVLIKEITRRSNLHNIDVAYFTAHLDLPNKVVSTYYWQRPINVEKIFDLDLLQPDFPGQNIKKYYKIDDCFTINISELQKDDCKECCQMFNEFHNKFKISIHFDEEHFESHFMPKKNVISSWVVKQDNKITDFISFFDIPSKVSNSTKYNEWRAAYCYYYFNTKTKLEELVQNCLVLLKRNNIDILNSTDLYDNNDFLDKLKFKKSSSELRFFFYNWNCPNVKNNEMALIMV